VKDETVKVSGALCCGMVLGWLWASRPEVIAEVKLLDVVTAFGTLAAAVVAAWLGTREIRMRRHEDRRRMTYARTALWPEFRRYLAAIERLESDPQKRDVSTAQLITRLTIEDWVREIIRDLDGSEFQNAADVLAYISHARRHLVELHHRSGEYPNGDKRKVKSVQLSLTRARRLIAPLVFEWRYRRPFEPRGSGRRT
jgi:hypothetical protein